MNRNIWVILVVSLLLIVALILPSCTQPAPAPKPSTPTPAPAPAPAATKTIKFSYTMPTGAAVGKGYEWFAGEFTKRSQGRYKVEAYGGSKLIPLEASLDSVKKGVAEIVMTSHGSFPKDFALSLVTGIPTFGLPDFTTPKGFVDGNAAWWEFYNAVPEIKAENSAGFVPVHYLMLDPYNLVSKSAEIHSPKDFAGLKIGGSGAKMEIVSANGGAKVQMIPPNSYTTLDKGVADAGFLTFSQVSDYKLTELCKYYYDMDFGSGQHIIMMNKEAFSAMSPADQQLLLQTFKDSVPVSAEGSITDNQKGRKMVVDAGYKVTAPTPDERKLWKAGVEPAVAQWVKDAKAVNISQATLDKVLEAWKQIQAKYVK